MMKWYHYLMCFFGGAFIANFFPHFVNGILDRLWRSREEGKGKTQ